MILTRAVRRVPERKRAVERELTMDVRGLVRGPDAANVHLTWVDRKLRPGDEIRIQVVRGTADKPKQVRREDPDFIAKAKRRYYERLKKEYGD